MNLLLFFFQNLYNCIRSWYVLWIMQFKTEDTCSLVRFILIKINFNQKNMMLFCNIIFLIKTYSCSIFDCGKIKRFYFSFVTICTFWPEINLFIWIRNGIRYSGTLWDTPVSNLQTHKIWNFGKTPIKLSALIFWSICHVLHTLILQTKYF